MNPEEQSKSKIPERVVPSREDVATDEFLAEKGNISDMVARVSTDVLLQARALTGDAKVEFLQINKDRLKKIHALLEEEFRSSDTVN